MRKKWLPFVFALLLAVPVSADAAKTIKAETGKDILKISSDELSEGVTFSLEKDQPLRVKFPDGKTETFTFSTEDTENASKAAGRTKRVSVERACGTAILELFGNAVYYGRSVSFDGDVYLGFRGINTFFDENETKVVKRTGRGNRCAQAGTSGTMRIKEPVTDAIFTKKFRFELWLDPANSETAIINLIG